MLGNKDFRNVILSHFLTGIAPQTQLQCSGPKIRELIVSQQLVEAAVLKIATSPNAPSRVAQGSFIMLAARVAQVVIEVSKLLGIKYFITAKYIAQHPNNAH